MQKGIILVQSKYGAAQTYATWLKEATGYDCITLKQAKRENLNRYHTIVLCGGIYASGIAGISFFKKHISEYSGKRLAVFCVGASPYDEKALEQIKAFNLKDTLSGIPLFYGRGAWDVNRMTFGDRTLCKLLQKAVAKKDPNAETFEPWMAALMEASDNVCDWKDKTYLEPLLAFLKDTPIVYKGENG
ncbi:MAG: flavodoxin [Clostridia bacterium]|nr:flavodoxin [Clostridia bacterium]